MPYCEAGDLGRMISNSKRNNSFMLESQVLKWMAQVGLAVDFLHSNGFIHRDLKPCNILLSDGGQYVKVADLGLALDVKRSENEKSTVVAEVHNLLQTRLTTYP